ncbi:MAG TPA: glycosyltransferase, partial [Terriglobales bacterium]|nr:glycosyltransferase [Terriglobales bacterium]
MPDIPTVSVTATVLNEADDIDALVSTLAEQTLRPEVIVVDGGSTDGTWERLQAAQFKYPGLVAIRDESCNLKASRGPIARGRNVGIAAAHSEIIACADCGCVYDPEWLDRLTAPIRNGDAEYTLGGSCFDPQDQTMWDLASAPFFGLKQRADGTTRSCTARSMAFRKELWRRVGGFPETSFLGEDTSFDLLVRKFVTPVYAERAQAIYRPHHTLKSALSMMARYGVADGVLGTRRSRLLRNSLRCAAEVAAVLLLPRTAIPLLCMLLLEIYFAFRLDWRSFSRHAGPRAYAARLLYSLAVPWIAAWNQAVGELTKTN